MKPLSRQGVLLLIAFWGAATLAAEPTADPRQLLLY